MAIKKLILAAAIPAMLAGTSFAQTATTEYRELEDKSVQIAPFNLTVGAVDDMKVFGADRVRIGEIEDVLADGTGKAVAFVIELEDDLYTDE